MLKLEVRAIYLSHLALAGFDTNQWIIRIFDTSLPFVESTNFFMKCRKQCLRILCEFCTLHTGATVAVTLLKSSANTSESKVVVNQ